ncbi:hypothetical protein F2P45_21450 [Massilia sp. CCM 8733]|uniref:Uncharacterized protein n=1 Tax=Massilia mucilaginosa TaxID=2609282 RepID=A0ABX0NXF5_9BURK|nr:hypothetical protein [Massilia mucilaginosa]NHZ91552.1 hypothetical protein [Massilia mucilaginosa]
MKNTRRILFISIFQLFIVSEVVADAHAPLAPPTIFTVNYIVADEIFQGPCIHTEFGCHPPTPIILKPEIKRLESIDGKYVVEMHAKLSQVEQRLNSTNQALEASNVIINDLRERLKAMECKNNNSPPPC